MITGASSLDRPSTLPDISGSVRVSLYSLEGVELTGMHTHSTITDDDSTWTRGIHRFAYENQRTYNTLSRIACSESPEVMMVMRAGSSIIRSERHWVTSCHDMPGRQQGSREMQVETVNVLWQMNRYLRTLTRYGAVSELLKRIASDYGLAVHCLADSAVHYVQTNQSDYGFIAERLRPSTVLTEGEVLGDFRLGVRHGSSGGTLVFAPLKSKARPHNWFFMAMDDPRIKLHGPITFVNNTQLSAARGSSGVRANVADPYSTNYQSVDSAPTLTVESLAPDANVRSVGPLHTVMVTLDNVTRYSKAQDTAVCLRDAARMASFEATITLDSQPWFESGDRITVRSVSGSPYNTDWWVIKSVTIINSGDATTHLLLQTDGAAVPQDNGIQIQSPDTPNAQYVPQNQVPVVPAPAKVRSSGNVRTEVRDPDLPPLPPLPDDLQNNAPAGLPESNEPVVDPITGLPPLPDVGPEALISPISR